MSSAFFSWARFLRIIGVLLGLALLGGCTATRIGYNHVDTPAYWWLDDHLDFDEEQSRQVREHLRVLHQWHRSEELPAYASLLNHMQVLAGGTVTATQVCQVTEQVRVHLRRLGERTAPGIAAMVPTLKSEQLRELALEFDKRNRKWRSEWIDLSTEERDERRFTQALDRTENFYGRLDEKQLAVLRDQLANSGFDARRSYAERLRRQQDILATLREHGRGARPAERASHVQAEILSLVRRSIDSSDPSYQRHLNAMLERNCELIAALHNSASPAQRQNAANKLRGYEADARTLAAKK